MLGGVILILIPVGTWYLPFLNDEREICEAVRETGSLLLAKGGKREE